MNHLKHAASDLFQSTWGFLFVLEFARAVYNEVCLKPNRCNLIGFLGHDGLRGDIDCAHTRLGAQGCASSHVTALGCTWVGKLAREGGSNRLCLPKEVQLCTVLYFYTRVDLSLHLSFPISPSLPRLQLHVFTVCIHLCIATWVFISIILSTKYLSSS